MQDKWHVKKKGYLKIHIVVNIKTKEILSLEVTDGKIMPKLVEYILKGSNNNIKIKSDLGDGYYDSNKNFNYLQKKNIRPGIRVRTNSNISLKNNSSRNRAVYSQSKDLLKWKKSRKYGRSRWIAVETVFLSIKRTYGVLCCTIIIFLTGIVYCFSNRYYLVV